MNKHDLLYQRITAHGRALQSIFNLPDTDPVELCKKLRRIEAKANRLAVDYCNGTIDAEEIDEQADKIFYKVDALLHFTAQDIPVIFNRDPRGYALKIDDGYIREHNINIYRDWGGYGIIAPDLTEG
jgi:Asp-tRNA(Asn)/Glu-tRNA(Gln) amidotransferase A subunit family amidase